LIDFIGQEVAAAKLSVEQELVSAQQVQKDLISENESLLGELEGIQVDLEVVQARHSQLEGRNAQLLADFADVTRVADTQRQAAECARTELAKLQLRLEGVPPLEAELSRMHAAFDAERAARVAADKAAAVADARLEQSKALVDDLRVRLARAETDVREMHREAANLRNQVSSLQGSLDSTCKELTQTKEDARRAEAAAAELKGKLAAALSNQQRGATESADPERA
jgi:chromosome segregation ATPase